MTDLLPYSGVRSTAALEPSPGPEVRFGGVVGSAFEADWIRQDRLGLFDRRRDEMYARIYERLGTDGQAAVEAELQEASPADRDLMRFRPLPAGSPAQRAAPPAAESANPWARRAAILAAIDRLPPDVRGRLSGLPLTEEEIDATVAAMLNRELTYAEADVALGRDSDIPLPLIGSLGQFVGGTASVMAEPTQWPFLMMGPGAGAGLGMRIAADAGFSALGEAVQIPAEQVQAERLGIEATDPLARVALGAAAGGLFRGGIELGAAGLREIETRAARQREQALAEAQAKLAELDAGTRGAVLQLTDQRGVVDSTPPGVDAIDHSVALEAAGETLTRPVLQLTDSVRSRISEGTLRLSLGQIVTGGAAQGVLRLPRSLALDGPGALVLDFGDVMRPDGTRVADTPPLQLTGADVLGDPARPLQLTGEQMTAGQPVLELPVMPQGEVLRLTLADVLAGRTAPPGVPRRPLTLTGGDLAPGAQPPLALRPGQIAPGNPGDTLVLSVGQIVREGDRTVLKLQVDEIVAGGRWLPVPVQEGALVPVPRDPPAPPPEPRDVPALAAPDRPLLLPAPDRADGPAPAEAGLVGRIIAVESGGNPDARNPASSAAGLGQFIDSTWLSTVKKWRPDLAAKHSDAELLAMKAGAATAELQREMIRRHAQDIRAGLGGRGLPTDDGAVYLGWFAGEDAAAKVLAADATVPLRDLLSAEAIAANAGLKFDGLPFAEWSAGQMTAWARRKMGLASSDLSDYPRAAGVVSFDPLTIEADPARFQFKRMLDARTGETGALANTRDWDPAAGIGVVVWEDFAGRRFIVEGHQRLGLARRLMAEGHAPIEMSGILYREADGLSAEMMRVYGALVNIRRGTASPLDAAQVIRDHPEAARTLDMTRGQLGMARDLARLAPEIDALIWQGVLPEHFAAVIGRVAPGDAQMQGAILRAMRELEPDNLVQAEAIARDVRRMGLERKAEAAQGSLFGDDFVFEDAGVRERSRVMDRALKDLSRDRGIFKRLANEADTIAEEGNVLVTDRNRQRADQAERAIVTIQRLASEPGPVRDALDRAGRDAKSRGIAAAARDFAEAVRAAVEGREPAGGGGRGAGGGGADEAPARPRDAGDGEAEQLNAASAREIAAELDAVEPLEVPAETMRDMFADPVNGRGAELQAEVIERDVRAALGQDEVPDGAGTREPAAARPAAEGGGAAPRDAGAADAAPGARPAGDRPGYAAPDGTRLTPDEAAAMAAETQALRAEALPQGDLDIVLPRMDGGDGTETRSMSSLLDEIDADRDFLEQLEICLPKGGAA